MQRFNFEEECSENSVRGHLRNTIYLVLQVDIKVDYAIVVPPVQCGQLDVSLEHLRYQSEPLMANMSWALQEKKYMKMKLRADIKPAD